MANTKLDRIERDIEKTRAKILEYQKRLKDLEAQKIEEENAQIVQMVKAVHLDGAQLAAFLSAYASGEIALPQNRTPASKSAEPSINGLPAAAAKPASRRRLWRGAPAPAASADVPSR